METKGYLQSKTIRSLIILLIIVLTNILGLGEAQPGQTYDTMCELEGRQTEQIKNLLLLGGIGTAGYYRVKADTKLGKKKEGDT